MTYPLGHNGMPNCEINVLMHCGAALEGGYPLWSGGLLDGVEPVLVHGFPSGSGATEQIRLDEAQQCCRPGLGYEILTNYCAGVSICRY